uniref:Uncharacterized protein n=1 Tax=Heterorhabditis bacteriophora TaxID=37862 RepID=A0A1I7XFJ8_HETBA
MDHGHEVVYQHRSGHPMDGEDDLRMMDESVEGHEYGVGVVNMTAFIKISRMKNTHNFVYNIKSDN